MMLGAQCRNLDFADSTSQSAHLLGVSSVSGNVSLPKVTANARKLVRLLGRMGKTKDVNGPTTPDEKYLNLAAVYGGAGTPLLRDNKYAPEIHG